MKDSISVECPLGNISVEISSDSVANLDILRDNIINWYEGFASWMQNEGKQVNTTAFRYVDTDSSTAQVRKQVKKAYTTPVLEVRIGDEIHRFVATVSNDYKPSPTDWTDEDVADLITLRDGIESLEWVLETIGPYTKSYIFKERYDQLKSLLDDLLQPTYDDMDKDYRDYVKCPVPEYQNKYCGSPEDCKKCEYRKKKLNSLYGKPFPRFTSLPCGFYNGNCDHKLECKTCPHSPYKEK